MSRQALRAILFSFIAGSMLAVQAAALAETNSSSIIYRINSSNERQEMMVNTSRILTLERKIPQAQVNNPEILTLTPLSPTEIQLAAKKAGVTQVNLWDENNQIFTVDVVVYGDTRELQMILDEQFPNASLKVRGISNGVLISGFVDQPHDVQAIVQIAEQFYPQKVSTRLQVGGVQQVLLHVKVMEVSRTKLRALGFDWTYLSGPTQIVSAAAGIISAASGDGGGTPVDSSGNFRFNVVSGSSTFWGFLDAMRQDNMAKLLAEPTLVTVSGRPAYFQSGGEVPVTTGGGLGVPANTVYKPYGTQINFVPIVLGNGRIRLEVRPQVSEVDASRGLGDQPAFRTRQVDTGVEMKAGQTLAIAGLIQNRVESERRGIPWVSELPYIGVAFRNTREEMNEVELIVLVTPELVEGMDAEQVPPCGPGMETTSPDDPELYLKGYLEVPFCCNGQGCAQCAGAAPMPGMIGSQGGQTIRPGEIRSPAPSQSGPAEPLTAPSASTSRPITRTAAPLRTAQPLPPASTSVQPLPGMIGPVGYDQAR